MPNHGLTSPILSVLIRSQAVVVCLAVLAVVMGPGYVPPSRPPAYLLVIAANAPGWMRVGGPGRYLCDGTSTTGGDQVALKAAIDSLDLNGDGDWTHIGGGGVIERGGHF